MTIDVSVTVLGFEVSLSVFINLLAKEEYESVKKGENKECELCDWIGEFQYNFSFQRLEHVLEKKFNFDTYKPVKSFHDIYTFIYHHDNPRYGDDDSDVDDIKVIVGIPVSIVHHSDHLSEYMKIKVVRTPADILRSIEEDLPKIAKCLNLSEVPELGYFATANDCNCCS